MSNTPTPPPVIVPPAREVPPPPPVGQGRRRNNAAIFIGLAVFGVFVSGFGVFSFVRQFSAQSTLLASDSDLEAPLPIEMTEADRKLLADRFSDADKKAIHNHLVERIGETTTVSVLHVSQCGHGDYWQVRDDFRPGWFRPGEGRMVLATYVVGDPKSILGRKKRMFVFDKEGKIQDTYDDYKRAKLP